MVSYYTKAINHFGKFVPCVEGRVLAHLGEPTRLVRLETEAEAEDLSKKFCKALYAANYGNFSTEGDELFLDFTFGDNYMLDQHPLSAQA